MEPAVEFRSAIPGNGNQTSAEVLARQQECTCPKLNLLKGSAEFCAWQHRNRARAEDLARRKACWAWLCLVCGLIILCGVPYALLSKDIVRSQVSIKLEFIASELRNCFPPGMPAFASHCSSIASGQAYDCWLQVMLPAHPETATTTFRTWPSSATVEAVEIHQAGPGYV